MDTKDLKKLLGKDTQNMSEDQLKKILVDIMQRNAVNQRNLLSHQLQHSSAYYSDSKKNSGRNSKKAIMTAGSPFRQTNIYAP